ncbi:MULTISPECIES: colicin E1 family microcin immunity protein [unclassified Pseudomonas]|uniref:colicin E1 family microcin immunity protein n=1 Tax=unclassified Pseudomonas TaxID=196821 RepID=UPI003DA98444
MNKKYYFSNLLISLSLLALGLIVWFYKEPLYETTNLFYLITCLCSTFLFPFSRKLIENTCLRFTSREFWTTGLLTESPGKNGLYVIYFFICMITAIPLGGSFLIYLGLKRVV